MAKGNAAIQLIGMVDSSNVRHVAISLQLLDIPFSHRSLSVSAPLRSFRKSAWVTGQVFAPYSALEAELVQKPPQLGPVSAPR